MRCTSCGHTPHSHDDLGCHVTILTGWRESEKRFTGERPCQCTEYTEHVYSAPASENGCPHEVAPALGPNCVHCGRSIKETAA
jgi:hypothetical protein